MPRCAWRVWRASPRGNPCTKHTEEGDRHGGDRGTLRGGGGRTGVGYHDPLLLRLDMFPLPTLAFCIEGGQARPDAQKPVVGETSRRRESGCAAPRVAPSSSSHGPPARPDVLHLGQGTPRPDSQKPGAGATTRGGKSNTHTQAPPSKRRHDPSPLRNDPQRRGDTH